MRDAVFAALSGRFFYGWMILAVAGLGIFASGPGQSHTFSVFVGPISEDLGIEKTAISAAYGSATLIAAFLLPFMGRQVDRFGPRKTAIVVIILLGFACLLFGAVTNVILLGLSFGALRFLGQGSLMLNCANLVSQWFSKRRGFAMSLMVMGFAASIAIHPPLGQYLIDSLGWRTAWIVLGVMTWLLMLPPLLLLVFDKPEEKGLKPDGVLAEPKPASAGAAATPAEATITGLTLNEALRTPTFYILSIGWFSIAMLVTTLHFYQVSILTMKGLSAELAAWMFPIVATTMAITMPLVGTMFDTIRTRYVVAIALVVMALSLILASIATSPLLAVLYAAMFGLNNAFSMTMFGYIWPRYFGRLHLGSIQGTGQMIGVIGASLGPLPIGYAFDIADPGVGATVTNTLQLLALFPLACALLAVMMLRTPKAVTGSEHLE